MVETKWWSRGGSNSWPPHCELDDRQKCKYLPFQKLQPPRKIKGFAVLSHSLPAPHRAVLPILSTNWPQILVPAPVWRVMRVWRIVLFAAGLNNPKTVALRALLDHEATGPCRVRSAVTFPCRVRRIPCLVKTTDLLRHSNAETRGVAARSCESCSLRRFPTYFSGHSLRL